MSALVDKLIELDRKGMIVHIDRVTPTCIKVYLNNGFGVSVLQESRADVRDGVAEVGIIFGAGGMTHSATIASRAFDMDMGSDSVRNGLEAGEIIAILTRMKGWPSDLEPGGPVTWENVQELIGAYGGTGLMWDGGTWEVRDLNRFPFCLITCDEVTEVMYDSLDPADAYDEDGQLTKEAGEIIARVLNERLNLA